jgi:Fe-S-cluster-containing dehydrogenase component
MVKRLAVVDVDLCVGCQSCMQACTRRFGDAGLGRSAIHVHSLGGFERGFVIRVCRACENDPPCHKVCPTGAISIRKGGGVSINYSKCIACGNCVKACTLQAVMWDQKLDKPLICVYCGTCTKYCPYGVLTMEEIPERSGSQQ